MGNAWATVTLGDVASISLSGVDKHITPGEESVRLCNYLDVYRSRHLTGSHDFSPGTATPNEIERFQLRKGDVLITKDSETPDDIGIPALVVDDLAGTICGYHLALIRPTEKVNPQFLLCHLQSEVSKRHFLRAATGVTRFGLGIRVIVSLPILLPSPDEQADIARILDAVDTAIERTREAEAESKRLKQAVLQRFFYAALGETAYADRPTKKVPAGWALVPTERLLAEEPKNGVSPKASSQPPGTPTFIEFRIKKAKIFPRRAFALLMRSPIVSLPCVKGGWTWRIRRISSTSACRKRRQGCFRSNEETC